MKKKQLLNLPKLEATDEMMDTAQADRPSKEKSKWSGRYVKEAYTYKLYLRCCVECGILKVALFLPDVMRTGGRQASYELYISKGEETFLTYDRVASKWRTVTLSNIYWPSYYYESDGVFLSQEDANKIGGYLGIDDGNYKGLLHYQQGIRVKELEKRHKKETDPWDEDLRQTPPWPKDWQQWLRKVAIPKQYLYYHYKKGGAKTGYCTYCERDVPIQNPRHNKEGRCPHCRHKVTYKAVGKAGIVQSGNFFAYLIQRCRDGVMVREFRVNQIIRKGEYHSPELHDQEMRRTIYDQGFNPRSYYWGLYKQRNDRWIRTNPCKAHYSGDLGKVYGKTLPHLANNQLLTTGLVEWVQSKETVDPEKYLAVYKEIPLIEKVLKAHLPRLTDELYNSGWQSSIREILTDSSSLTKSLGIDTRKLKRLRDMNGGLLHLRWLQYEKISGKDIPRDVFEWFIKEQVEPSDLKFISGKMSPLQIRNYLQRQMKELNVSCQRVIGLWADYLSMAKRLKMNTNDEIIYRVRKLRQRHDELAELCRRKASELRADEISEKFPGIHKIFSKLKDKYGYMGERYSVIAPSCVLDIIKEGEALHHCVDTSTRYWERMEQDESYILFCRKNEEPWRPYYTLEIEPDGTIRQKRTEYDRQGKDIDKIQQFLLEWQSVVAERITQEDKVLAEKSTVARQNNFAELSQKRAIIHTGDLAGQRLVDVLQADLMLNKAA